MTPSRIILVGGLVLLCLLFAAGIGIGLTQSNDQPLSAGWTSQLGDVLTQPSGAGDLEPDAVACLENGALTVARDSTCRYGLKSGFLGRRLKLKVITVAPPGTVALGLTQPGTIPTVKTLRQPGDEAELRYQKQGTELAVACTGPAGCRLQVEGG